ncbi:MAG: GerMN domain-containing protein [Acidimicrobiales bacterium]
MSPRSWVTRLVALGGVGAMMLVGCGVPTDDAPHAVDDVPDALLVPTPTTAGSEPAQVPGLRYTATLHWFEDGVLVARARELPDLQPGTVLRALLGGPVELDGDVQTSLPPGTELEGVGRLVQGILPIDLSRQIADNIEGEELRKAIVQIVWTATGFPGVIKVDFEVGGDPFPVITDEGTVSRPVNRSDYRSIEPVDDTTTTATTTTTA